MPAHLRRYVETWQQVHPDWALAVWSEANLDWLANQTLFDRAEEITPHVGQFRSDVARLEILHRYGGVYVDCDFEARQRIDDLCDAACWAAWETDGVWVNNAIVGAEPGHPFLTDAIAALPESVERNRGKRPNIMSGPQFITPIALTHDITLHPSAWFYPYRWDELDRADDDFPSAYAVHHWENARKRRKKARTHA